MSLDTKLRAARRRMAEAVARATLPGLTGPALIEAWRLVALAVRDARILKRQIEAKETTE